jgi:isopenicillin N synthase-like dioxygenase
MSFKSLPIIDLALAEDASTKPELLERLADALFRVGFLYLVNHGVEKEASELMEFMPEVFAVSDEEKQKVAMTTNPHFVGYTKLGAEMTARAVDQREQFDFGSATEVDPLNPDVSDRANPQWRRIQGPSPYLPDSVLPGFREKVETYISKMDNLSNRLLGLIGECLKLDSDALMPFVGKMNRLKLIKYPGSEENKQGVGPHKDSSGLLTLLLQDSVGGLEVLNSDGEWIPAKPIPNSFVVNMAQGFEALTGGRCTATSHRVISPPPGVTRYSIPYFSSVRLDLTMDMINKQLDHIQGRIPEPTDQKRRNNQASTEFLDPKYSCFGEAHLRNRIISHRDVAAIWYKDIKDKYLAEVL